MAAPRNEAAVNWSVLTERIAAVRADTEANVVRVREAYDRLQALRAERAAGRSRREALHESAYARMQARLESLPVIEQAKGILMAQTGCSPDEAFDMLRRASQRTNVRVRDLSEEIVRRTVKAAPTAPPAPPERAGSVRRGLPVR